MMRGIKVIVRFEKKGLMRYISHLDLLRLFQRACRRADLPLALTEGFNPHPKLKVEPALKLGVESKDLKAEMVLHTFVSSEDIRRRLDGELPTGIEITDVGETRWK